MTDDDDLAARYCETIEGWLASLRWRYATVDELPPWEVDRKIAADEQEIAALLREAIDEMKES